MRRRPNGDHKLAKARGRKVKTPKRGRRKAEEQPGFAAQLQAILNVLPAYTWYAGPSGALTFVNKRTAAYFGLPKDHPLCFGVDVGAQWDDWVSLLHPEDREEARKYWSACLRTGEAGGHSYRVRSAQGDYHWFLTYFEPLRARDGTLLLWLGATLDIEELKWTEQALRESEAKFRDYAETASDWFWEIDPDYKFTLLTENAFGSHAADRIGTGCWDHALDLETEPEKCAFFGQPSIHVNRFVTSYIARWTATPLRCT